MKYWVFAAALVPAIALATPITFTTAGGKSVKVRVKQKSTNPAPVAAAALAAGGLGSALASDVTLGGISATQLVYGAGVNPQQGASGNSIGFAGAYGGSGSGDWSSFAKFSGTSSLGAVNSMLSGLTLTMGFGLTDLRHGTWSITNNSIGQDLSLDLVFAMHTGGGSGSWLFDNYQLGAASTAVGAWSLNLLNNGGQLADYSNLTLFARNAVAAPVRTSSPASGQDDAAASGAGTSPETAPAAGGGDTVAIQIPIGELLEELNKHGNIEPGSEIEFEGLFGGGAAAGEVPEPGTLAVFLSGLAMFGATVWQRKRGAARR